MPTNAMDSTTASLLTLEPLSDVLHRLGDVSPNRIMTLGGLRAASPEDVLQFCDGEPRRLCELVDGLLVEKVMGHIESRLAARLIQALLNFLDQKDLGIVAGADAPHQLTDDVVRFPDVVFIAYSDIPPDSDPATPMPRWKPTLAVEIISPANTRLEMERKLKDYFTAGSKLVWYVYPESHSVVVYTSPQSHHRLTEAEMLTGGDVLPGFTISIRDWFQKAGSVRPNG